MNTSKYIEDKKSLNKRKYTTLILWLIPFAVTEVLLFINLPAQSNLIFMIFLVFIVFTSILIILIYPSLKIEIKVPPLEISDHGFTNPLYTNNDNRKFINIQSIKKAIFYYIWHHGKKKYVRIDILTEEANHDQQIYTYIFNDIGYKNIEAICCIIIEKIDKSKYNEKYLDNIWKLHER